MENKGGHNMRRLTLMLFQLFLAIFAIYAVLYDVPNEYLFVPLLCLLAMFFLGRHPKTSSESRQDRIMADAWVPIPQLLCSSSRPPLIFAICSVGVFSTCHFFPQFCNLGFSPDISRVACCDRGYGRPSGRPRVSDPATYRSGTPRIQLPAVARWHAHLRGLATAIHKISGLIRGRCVR